MADTFFDLGLPDMPPDEQKIYGVALGMVINNIDATGEARVQLQLPWLPGYEPWARLAMLMAGMGRGTYFIPQIGDEVLVAFNQGDVREPFVLGTLWNTTDRPPALSPTDAITKRAIRTPLGHELVFDDALQSVTITTSTQQTLSMGIKEVQLAAGTLPPPTRASITLDSLGNVTISAMKSLTLKSPQITIDGGLVTVKGKAGVTVDGGADCTIRGATVNIN
jgi:uncharacterized protein involved in type VI secretion and phage assembly